MRNRTTVTSTRLRKVRESRRINLRFMLGYSSVCTVILQSGRVCRLLLDFSAVFQFMGLMQMGIVASCGHFMEISAIAEISAMRQMSESLD